MREAGKSAETERETGGESEKSPVKQSGREAKISLRGLFGHRWIMKNISFFLFLAGLGVVYIYNGHYAEKTIRDIGKTSRELKEMQYEYKTLRSEVMFRSKQSELAKAVAPFGLKELTTPPVMITDSIK
ncbi:MAG: FtsL-like putative cell division protein [Puia sp.]|nr:FtsL-like putative cell division protein [Puia sp.]